MNLLELSPVILFGWPAILVALALSVMGVVRRRSKWLVVAAIVIIPLSLYLAGTPRFSWIALVFPLLLIGASIAVRRSHLWLAWTLFVPFVGFFGWLAVIVLSE